KAKALAAWGVSQDAFKRGHASETHDPALVKAATAKPGEVLRRPTAGARGKVQALRPAKPAKTKGPSKAQLKKVADLEAQLSAMDARFETERAKLASEAAALTKRRTALEARAQAERSRLEARLATARAALG